MVSVSKALNGKRPLAYWSGTKQKTCHFSGRFFRMNSLFYFFRYSSVAPSIGLNNYSLSEHFYEPAELQFLEFSDSCFMAQVP